MAEIWDILDHLDRNPGDHEERWKLAKKFYAAWEYEQALEHLLLQRQAAGQRRQPEPWLGWHDVVNLRPGESLALRFVQRQAGDRLFHCHILEHEDQGMMATLRVLG